MAKSSKKLRITTKTPSYAKAAEVKRRRKEIKKSFVFFVSVVKKRKFKQGVCPLTEAIVSEISVETL